MAAWLSPGTGSSWGRVAGLGKAVVLASAISLLGAAVRKQPITFLIHASLTAFLSKEGSNDCSMPETRAWVECLIKKKVQHEWKLLQEPQLRVLPAPDPRWEQTIPELHVHDLVQPPA